MIMIKYHDYNMLMTMKTVTYNDDGDDKRGGKFFWIVTLLSFIQKLVT